MAVEGSTIKVRGVRELSSALRRVDKDLPKQLGTGLQKISQFVINRARPKVPKRTGKARASMTARKRQNAAVVSVGGSRAPYYPWLDFGGTVGRSRRVSRPFLRKGRYIYPTIGENDLVIKQMLDTEIKRVATAAGFATSGRSYRG